MQRAYAKNAQVTLPPFGTLRAGNGRRVDVCAGKTGRDQVITCANLWTTRLQSVWAIGRSGLFFFFHRFSKSLQRLNFRQGKKPFIVAEAIHLKACNLVNSCPDHCSDLDALRCYAKRVGNGACRSGLTIDLKIHAWTTTTASPDNMQIVNCGNELGGRRFGQRILKHPANDSRFAARNWSGGYFSAWHSNSLVENS